MNLSPKTAERYLQLAEVQIIPHLGTTALQRLKPKHVKDWHHKLLKAGGKDGRALSARTVGHAHRLLHRALQMAVEIEVLTRNVASAVSPPAVKDSEVEILTEDQVSLVIERLAGHPLYEIAVVPGLACGRRARRRLLEQRMALGLGRPEGNTLLFAELDCSPRRPDQLSWLWRSACKSLKLPAVSFHALRHTRAAALIAAGLDVVAISRRLGTGART